MAEGLFRDANGFLRDANGRFASATGGSVGSSSGSRRARRVAPHATRKGGSRSRSVPEKVVLAGADIGGEKLRKSKSKRNRLAGVVLSAAGSVMRNRNVRSAVRRGV